MVLFMFSKTVLKTGTKHDLRDLLQSFSQKELSLYIDLTNVASSDQLADTLTKPLPRTRFHQLLLSHPDSRSDSIGGSEPVSGCETIYLGLFTFFFFFFSLTYTCGYTNNFCNNQKSFTYTKELPLEWYPLKSIHIC